MNYIGIPVECDYILPDEGYGRLVDALSLVVEDGDLVVISETPISTMEGNLVDESEYDYSLLSWIICELWCRLVWGYLFSPFGYDKRTISNLRKMPVEAHSHKEFILRRYGLKHALMPSGEAGVDLSNVPGNYVSLLPENPKRSAFRIRDLIEEACGVCVDVMIIDTDATFCIFGKLFTCIPLSVDGIVNDMGIYGYILRFFSKRVGSTPLASTCDKNVLSLIEIANIAEECQKNASDDYFETVYNMTDTFNVDIDKVSVEMLKKVRHMPAVIIRRKYL